MSSYRDTSDRRDSYPRSHSGTRYDGRDHRAERTPTDASRPVHAVPRPLGIKPRPGSTSASALHGDGRDTDGRSQATSSRSVRESSDRRRARDDDRNDVHRRTLESEGKSYSSGTMDSDQHLRAHPRDERKRDLDVSDANDAVTPLASGSTEQHLTPSQIVDEFKKRGHFDTVRKQLFSHFQTSEHKQAYLDHLQEYMLSCLQELSTEERLRLAAKDQRLQHSELSRWIEDGRVTQKAVSKMFANAPTANGSETGSGGFFGEQGGGLGHDITLRLQEVISAERQKLRVSATEEPESDDDGNDGEGSSNVTTPMVKSSATPLGRDTPRGLQSRSGSVGNRTPLNGVV